MAEAKGLSKPVKLKSDLSSFLGASELPRTDLRNLKEGETIDMMQMASVVGANIE